mmetsp:Transcript_6787/g.15022  ORF Transcript_6787/g.15022 Transcript_6787/m.15022 type:complete len:254 (+) Transcript_6787:1559-2320(+)
MTGPDSSEASWRSALDTASWMRSDLSEVMCSSRALLKAASSSWPSQGIIGTRTLLWNKSENAVSEASPTRAATAAKPSFPDARPTVRSFLASLSWASCRAAVCATTRGFSRASSRVDSSSPFSLRTLASKYAASASYPLTQLSTRLCALAPKPCTTLPALTSSCSVCQAWSLTMARIWSSLISAQRMLATMILCAGRLRSFCERMMSQMLRTLSAKASPGSLSSDLTRVSSPSGVNLLRSMTASATKSSCFSS